MQNTRLYCQGWSWESHKATFGNDHSKISFLNTDYPPVAITDRLFLNPFVIDRTLSDLSYTIEKTKIKGGNSAYFTASDIDFQITNIKTISAVQSTREFFKVLEDTTWIKYKFEIERKIGEEWKVIYVGTIDQDGVNEQLSTTRKNKKITVRAWGWESELKDYFSGMPLESMSDVMALGHTQYKVDYHNESIQYIKRASLTSFLPQLFNTAVNVEFEDNIRDRAWFVVERPHFVQFEAGGRLIWYKNGYAKAVQDGDTVYSFFIKLLYAMGWIFFVHVKGGMPTITIKNRSSLLLDEYDLNNVKHTGRPGRTLGKSSPYITFKHIVIPDGEMFGGTEYNNLMFGSPDLRGYRWIVLSQLSKQSLVPNHLESVHVYSTYYGQANFTPFTQRRGDFSYGYCASRPWGENSTATFTKYALPEGDVLFLDAGENENGMQVDQANKKNFDDWTRDPFSGTAMLFTGNYGNMLGYETKDAVSNRHLHVFNYWDYIKGDTDSWGLANNRKYDTIFVDNHRRFFQRRDNLAPKIGVKDVVTSPMISPKFNGDAYYGDEIFNIAKMKINFELEVTYFELTR